MQKHSLSLCLVVHDEEETIGRALKSALAVVDEVVVVDMGSSDNSRLIVEGYGARVVDHRDHGDQAEAWNAGLAAAYGDWILVMDADELLEPVRPVDLGRLLAERDTVAYHLRVREEGRDGSLQLRDEVRLFRNHPRARYRYAACPRIMPALREIADEEATEILPSALGLFRPPLDEESALQRRRGVLRRLRQAAELEPEEPWYQFELARNLAVYSEGEILPVKGFQSLLDALDGAWQGLVNAGEGALEGCEWLPALAVLRSRALRAAGRFEDARSCIDLAVERHGSSSSLRLELGAVLVELAGEDAAGHELRKLAAANFEALLDGPAELEPVWVESAAFHLWPRIWLGRCSMGEGELEAARASFLEALEIEPESVEAWCGLAELAEQQGRTRAALQIYLRAMRSGAFHARAWLGGARVLARLGFHDNALSWRDRVASLQPEHPALRADPGSAPESGQEVAAEV